MKKKIVAAVLVSSMALTGVAFANWGNGGRGYNVNCPQVQGMYSQQLDPAVQEKLDQFYSDTLDLRKQMAVKQAERMALMRSANPDPAAAAKLAGDLFDLRADMQEKAKAAGVDQYLGRFGGPGMGGGKSFHHRGRGMKGGGMGGGRF